MVLEVVIAKAQLALVPGAFYHQLMCLLQPDICGFMRTDSLVDHEPYVIGEALVGQEWGRFESFDGWYRR